MNCPGVKSRVNPSQPLRLCLGCLLYAWGLDGKGPAEHDGKVWACVEYTGSLAAGAQKATPATEATAAGVYHQQKEFANE